LPFPSNEKLFYEALITHSFAEVTNRKETLLNTMFGTILTDAFSHGFKWLTFALLSAAKLSYLKLDLLFACEQRGFLTVGWQQWSGVWFFTFWKLVTAHLYTNNSAKQRCPLENLENNFLDQQWLLTQAFWSPEFV